MVNKEGLTQSQVAWIQRKKDTGTYVDHYFTDTTHELIVVYYDRFSSVPYVFRAVGKRGGSEYVQGLASKHYHMLHGDELKTHPDDMENKQ